MRWITKQLLFTVGALLPVLLATDKSNREESKKSLAAQGIIRLTTSCSINLSKRKIYQASRQQNCCRQHPKKDSFQGRTKKEARTYPSKCNKCY